MLLLLVLQRPMSILGVHYSLYYLADTHASTHRCWCDVCHLEPLISKLSLPCVGMTVLDSISVLTCTQTIFVGAS